jgi:hypothetical protein
MKIHFEPYCSRLAELFMLIQTLILLCHKKDLCHVKKNIELTDRLPYFSILDAEGNLDEKLEPDLSEDLLVGLHRCMLLSRRFNERKLIDPSSGQLLGVGIVGREAGELIAEGVLAVEMGAMAEDVALSMHPHPTLSETEEEAAEAFLGSAKPILGR